VNDEDKNSIAELQAQVSALSAELAKAKSGSGSVGFLDSILSASLSGIYVYNIRDGHNEYINSQYTRITGWTLEEINQIPEDEFAELFHSDERAAVFAHIGDLIQSKDNRAFEIEYRFRTKGGDWIWCLSRDAAFEWGSDGAALRFIGTFLDVTERKKREEEKRKMEQQLQQTQRLESLGILAGGMAHDFNNILMGIMGHADLALDELSPLSPARECLTEITDASKRAADLCRQMLAYAGQGRFESRDISLHALIDETLHMLKTCISKKCRLNLNLKKELPSVHGDPAQLRQILMYLVINASEAIGERSGVITISTGAMECSEEYLEDGYVVESMEPGIYVWVEVSDTGCGIERESMGRLFEPFFTTKFTGRGLGLSAVVGIVRAHNGALRVCSEVGQGATFKVLFPAVAASEQAVLTSDPKADWRGEGTVLLVDDEETVRTVSSKLLRRLGLNVLLAEDGRQAVELYREGRSEIALVLLDLTMPHMNGEEAFRELRKLNPDVCVILASGYSETDVGGRFAGKGLAGCLQKPYTLNKLRGLLSDILPAADDGR